MTPSVLEPHRAGLFARLVLNGLFQSAAGITLALVVDAMLEQSRVGAGAEQQRVALLAALALLLTALRVWQRRDAEAFGISYVHDLRLAVIRHSFMLDGKAKSPALGPMLTRLTNDLLAVKNWLSFGIADVTVASITLAASLAFLVATTPMMGFAAAISAGLILAASLTLAVPLDRSVRNARSKRGRLSKIVGEKLQLRPTIAALGRADHETRRVGERSEALTADLVERALFSGLVRYTAVAAVPLTLLLHVVMTGHIAASPAAGGADGGIAWLLVLGIAMAQLQDITRAIDYRINYLPALGRIRRIMKLPIIGPTRDVPAPANDTGGKRAFDRLSVENLVVADGFAPLDFSIERGHLLTVSGAGREYWTRLTQTLARFERPVSGRILLDGECAGSMSIGRYRKLVRLVSPEIGPLPGTIGGNLRKAGMKDPHSPDALALFEACGVTLGAGDLTRFLDTPVAQCRASHAPLSDLKLRLLIALASNPRVLLIDDPMFDAADQTYWQPLLEWLGSQDIGVAISLGDLREQQGGDSSQIQMPQISLISRPGKGTIPEAPNSVRHSVC